MTCTHANLVAIARGAALALALSVLCAVQAQAQSVQTPLSAIQMYKAQTNNGVIFCYLGAKLGEARKCINEQRSECKSSLDSALGFLKKPAAIEALKSYHVAFISALEGTEPGPSERESTYEARQQLLKQKMIETWARFEIEQ